MRIVDSPESYLVVITSLNDIGLNSYLDDIGDPDWDPDISVSDGENLIEAAGRMCYRSWQAYDPAKPLATNPNVKKVREGNRDYIANVLKHKHGSILEHVSASFILKDVSRVLTHEITRHRAGTAFSQESLRYVRLNDLSFWIPTLIKENDAAIELFLGAITQMEQWQTQLAEIYDIDNMKDFHTKKLLTSAFRRIAPIGLSTCILVTGNLRSWRHIVEMRTSEGAEEEIRISCDQIAEALSVEFPNVFQDMELNDKGERIFVNSKV